MMLPIFLMNRSISKHLVIEDLNGLASMLDQGPSPDPYTKHFELYYHRSLRVNEKVLDYLLQACTNLKSMKLLNFP
jgi:hypothetical protein